MPYAILFGLLVPVVARMNEQLSRHVGQVAGAWLPHVAGAVFGLLFVVPFTGTAWVRGVRDVPWWGWGGGVVGFGMVIAANVALSRLGTAGFIAINVAAQLFTGAVLDHYGVAGSAVQHMSLVKGAGMVLLVAGAALVVRG